MASLRSLLPRLTSPLTPTRLFSTSTSAMSPSAAFIETLKVRRTHYQLSAGELALTDAQIVELVKEVVKHSPSSFNSQSARAIVVFGDSHTKHWDSVKAALKAILPAEAYPASEARLNGFAAAKGTVLLFEDQAVVEGLQKNIPLYAEHFPTWSEHSHGIVLQNLWTALATEKIGASLQHYGNLVTEPVKTDFAAPASWALKAQLVFGKIEGEAGPKEFKPLEERVTSFGAAQ